MSNANNNTQDGINISRDGNNNITIVVKEDKLVELFQKRTEMYNYLTEAYESKKDYFRMAVLAANIERMHYGTMMDKVTKIRELNEMQLHKRYNLDREIEIGGLANKLSDHGSWSEDEKKTIKDYHIRMNNYLVKFAKKINNFHRIQEELKDQSGSQITATLSYSNQKQITTCRGYSI